MSDHIHISLRRISVIVVSLMVGLSMVAYGDAFDSLAMRVSGLLLAVATTVFLGITSLDAMRE